MYIRHKLLFGFLVMIGLTLNLASVAWQGVGVLEKTNEDSMFLTGMMDDLQNARRHEKNYLLRMDPHWAKRVMDKLDHLHGTLQDERALPLFAERSEWEEALHLVQRYRELFKSSVEIHAPSATETLRAVEQEVVPVARRLHDLLEQRSTGMMRDREKIRAHMKRDFTVLVALSILFSTVVVILVVRSILHSLKVGIRFTEEIAAGHWSATMPRVQQDELGLLLRAMQEMGEKLQQMETSSTRSHAARLAVTAVLETGAAPLSMAEQLRIVLEIILTVPWLSLEYKGSIFLVSEGGEELVMAAQLGLSPVLLERCAQVAMGYCLCGRAAQSRETIFADHITETHEVRHPEMAPHGHYCIPILFGERLMGVLNLYVPDGHLRSAEEDAFLTTISYTLANLIEQRRNEERLKHVAGHDSLTGLPNRAQFQARLRESLAMASRSSGEVAVMFLDLDRFKQVNDTMGHKAGDELLKEATRRMLSCVRQYDLIARLGGDEFTIILPQLAQVDYVEFVARRILEELARPFLLTAGEANISGSIGIALYPRHAQELEVLLKQADAAMYEAKQAGRNAFRFFGEDLHTATMGDPPQTEGPHAALRGRETV
ncbi:MAG: diguanylate cyclase [Magnetococcus sp. MYC-9]